MQRVLGLVMLIIAQQVPIYTCIFLVGNA